MRVVDWQSALVKKLEDFSSQKFVWGRTDCMQLSLACAEAVTGKSAYPKAKGYKTEIGALRVLKRHGFENAEQAIEAKWTEIPASMAQRGDLGVIDTPQGAAAVVCAGVYFVGMSPEEGFTQVPRALVRRAFKVE